VRYVQPVNKIECSQGCQIIHQNLG